MDIIYTVIHREGAQKQIIHIVRRSLGYIDKRLIDHGDRVAYIADKIVEMAPGLSVDRDRLFILCLLHDIGAYKTEEIDNMVLFETDNVLNHAIFGYLFLKYATPLRDAAEAILYHHTSYQLLEKIETAYKTEAELIFLADRTDILLQSHHGSANALASLTRLSGTLFSPYLTGLLFDAEKKFDISGNIASGAYQERVVERINAIRMTDGDVLDFLKMLVYSIDFRSPFTVTHTANTAVISDYLAECLALDENDRTDILSGAFLHDIGKLAIPYSILESTGKLSPAEMAIMRTHVEVSEKILSGVVSDSVCRIAVRHHEKLNGKGYAHGLTAPELTLPQRIVAVADVISALINRRSYKEPFPPQKAISILEKMRDGGELCPRVVNEAIRRFDSILKITQKANDPIIGLYETITSQYRQMTAGHTNDRPH